MSDGHWTTCIQCDCRLWMPEELYVAAHAQAGKISFYCAYGHPMVFRSKEKIREEDEVRRQRDRLRQENARLEEVAADARRALKAEKAKGARIVKRIHAGVCPSCNRTFGDLARHMQSKHKEAVQ